MTIQKFPPTVAGQAAALAVPPPKNMEFRDGGFIVRTGADYTPDPEPSQEEKDAAEAKQDAKLQALAAMRPGQVIVWVNANVTNLVQAREVIATLAVAVSVLARRL